ncbi:RNA polymerase sigma factor [Kitasatospora camelliae]|uniref:Sigma-70 family RNA polymerase sigma factor n=1 Tax=Kitasatospora camelliae TaxID=3156397 RepID=A0AAU8K3C5_9ACTN
MRTPAALPVLTVPEPDPDPAALPVPDPDPAALPVPVPAAPLGLTDLVDLRRRLRPVLAALAGSGAEPEDLEQAVWLAVLERAVRRGLPRDRRSWLRGLAVREALAARAARREVPVPAVPVARPAPEQRYLAEERRRAVRLALAALPGRCPELLAALAESPELTYRQQALRLGVPRGSIGPTRSRCLAQLRALLAARRAE